MRGVLGVVFLFLFGVLALITAPRVQAGCGELIVQPTVGTFADTFFIRAADCDFAINNYRIRFTSPTAETTQVAFTPIAESCDDPNPLIPPGDCETAGIFSFQGNLLPEGTYIIDLLENGTSVRQTTITISESAVPPPANPPFVPTPAEPTSDRVQCDERPGTVNTAIGCVDFNDVNALTRFFLGWAMGIAGGVALLLIGFAAFRISTSQGDPRRLEGGKELLLSAIGGLLMVVLSVFLLRFIGVDLLGLF